MVNFSSKHGPEYQIQAKLTRFLQSRGWLVERMHGNVFQQGIPDLYVYHKKFGPRWIDVKVDKRYEFTKHQKVKWPLWERQGIGIWIIVAPTEEEYDKLFEPPNWRKYWKPKYDREIKELNEAMGELFNE